MTNGKYDELARTIIESKFSEVSKFTPEQLARMKKQDNSLKWGFRGILMDEISGQTEISVIMSEP